MGEFIVKWAKSLLGVKVAYSTDLRRKVVEHIKQGHSKTETSKIFGVSIGIIAKWEKKEKNGNLKDDKPKRPWRKIDPDALIEAVKKNPSYLMKDFAEIFKVSVPSIFNAFKVLKITRRKRSYFAKKEKSQTGRHFYHISQNIKKNI